MGYISKFHVYISYKFCTVISGLYLSFVIEETLYHVNHYGEVFTKKS
jgi:hypothetical protein